MYIYGISQLAEEVKNNLAYTQRTDLDFNNLEVIWCDLLLPSHKLLLRSKREKATMIIIKRFVKIKNKIQIKIKRADSDYISNKIQENKGNSKLLWQQLKQLGCSKNSKEKTKIVLK